MRVGVLHTVPALAPVFHELLQNHRSDLDIVHVVDASLLAASVAAGEATEDVQSDVAAHLEALRSVGAQAVLVTCSSIGEVAERAAAATGVALTRVDEAMAHAAADRAIAAGERDDRAGRIAVLATLSATLGPTTRIVRRTLDAAGADTTVLTATVVEGAAAARAAGDVAAHDALIAEALHATDADVIVLAQASMAQAAGDDARVLTSPRSGAAAFVATLGVDT